MAYAEISCVVVAPIGISKTKDMLFGPIVSGNAGSVILSPDGNQLSTTGSVTTKTAEGTISVAEFVVNDGLGSSVSATRYFAGYTISLPNTDVILVNESGKTMRVSNFTSFPSASGQGTFINGSGKLTVGATLHVSEDQGIGKYVSSSPFPVTVNFY